MPSRSHSHILVAIWQRNLAVSWMGILVAPGVAATATKDDEAPEKNWEGEMKPIVIALSICLMSLPMPAIAQDAFAAYQKGDYATAYKGFENLASQGNANAMNNLGMMLMSGQGVEKDSAAAAQWFQKSAERGQLDAITNLGTLYELGQGVPQSYARAAELYRAAADYGIGNAQYNLAQLFEAGKGVPKDPAQAYIWYSLAARAGDQDAAAAKAKLEPMLDKTLHGQAEAFVRNWKPKQG